jgi:hypothetical protein
VFSSSSNRRVWRASPAALLIAAAVSLCLASGSTAAAKSSPPPTCQSGQTLFTSGAVRAFQVSRDAQQEVLVCASATAKPVVIDDPGPAVGVGPSNFHIQGDRLGFELEDVSLGIGSLYAEVGWADLQSGDVADGVVNVGRGATKSEPLLPYLNLGYAIASNGAMAVIGGTTCQVVAVLPLRINPLRLAPPLVIFTAHHGGLDARSVAITTTTVTWRTTSGMRGSAPRSGGPTGTRKHTGGC